MKKVEYLFYFSGSQQDRLRVQFYKEKNRILQFIIQYEAEISGTWYAVIRYDTRHGYAHRDLVHVGGQIEKEPLPWEDYNLALTYATQDLKQNWQKYRRNFEEEINESRPNYEKEP